MWTENSSSDVGKFGTGVATEGKMVHAAGKSLVHNACVIVQMGLGSKREVRSNGQRVRAKALPRLVIDGNRTHGLCGKRGAVRR